MTDIDFSRCPDKSFQLKWLHEYLTHYHQYDGRTIDDEYVEQVYKEVNKFALLGLFAWIFWGLVQAEHSSIDYDFIE